MFGICLTCHGLTCASAFIAAHPKSDMKHFAYVSIKDTGIQVKHMLDHSDVKHMQKACDAHEGYLLVQLAWPERASLLSAIKLEYLEMYRCH